MNLRILFIAIYFRFYFKVRQRSTSRLYLYYFYFSFKILLDKNKIKWINKIKYSAPNRLVHFIVLLEDLLPNLAVIVRVTPAHFHCAHNQVLFKDIRSQLPIEFLTLIQRDLEHTQHKGKNGP